MISDAVLRLFGNFVGSSTWILPSLVGAYVSSISHLAHRSLHKAVRNVQGCEEHGLADSDFFSFNSEEVLSAMRSSALLPVVFLLFDQSHVSANEKPFFRANLEVARTG